MKNRQNSKFIILGNKMKFTIFDEICTAKWPTDRIGANFVGPEVLEPYQYIYLGAHPATYLTIIHMRTISPTDFRVLECIFERQKHKTDETVA